MKIALLAPAGAMHRYNGSFGKSLHYAPLTLTTLASLIPKDLNAEVKIYDETVGEIPKDINADLIGITVITGTSNRCYKYSDYFRSQGKTVVLGGVHPSLLPEEASKHADAVIVGLGDSTWKELLYDFEKGKLKHFYRSEPSESQTLKGRPVPSRNLLKKGDYITTNTVEVVRGCTQPCSFCAYPQAFGKFALKRPIDEVTREISNLPGKYVLFPDVNLLTDVGYAKEFFKALIPLKKKWFGLATSNVGIDDELVKLLKKSGCKGLLIGFESISQSSQKYINKGINNVESYDMLVKKLHKAGIAINGCYTFGSDEDTLDVFKETVKEINKLKIDLPRFSILTPFPNTQLFNDLEADNRIIEKNWAMYDVEHVVFKPKNMTVDELREGVEWAWKEIYSFKSIIRRIARFHNLFFISLLVNLSYRKYAKKFAKFTKEVMCDNSDIPG